MRACCCCFWLLWWALNPAAVHITFPITPVKLTSDVLIHDIYDGWRLEDKTMGCINITALAVLQPVIDAGKVPMFGEWPVRLTCYICQPGAPATPGTFVLQPHLAAARPATVAASQ